MKTISEIVQQKNDIIRVVNEWGFNTPDTDPPQLYKDIFNKSGEAGLCIFVKTAPSMMSLAKNESVRCSLLHQELTKTLNCQVWVTTSKSIPDLSATKTNDGTKTPKSSIFLSEDDDRIVKYYNEGKEATYQFAPPTSEKYEYKLGDETFNKIKQDVSKALSDATTKVISRGSPISSAPATVASSSTAEYSRTTPPRKVS